MTTRRYASSFQHRDLFTLTFQGITVRNATDAPATNTVPTPPPATARTAAPTTTIVVERQPPSPTKGNTHSIGSNLTMTLPVAVTALLVSVAAWVLYRRRGNHGRHKQAAETATVFHEMIHIPHTDPVVDTILAESNADLEAFNQSHGLVRRGGYLFPTTTKDESPRTTESTTAQSGSDHHSAAIQTKPQHQQSHWDVQRATADAPPANHTKVEPDSDLSEDEGNEPDARQPTPMESFMGWLLQVPLNHQVPGETNGDDDDDDDPRSVASSEEEEKKPVA